jgi:hypothetical protein
MPPFVRVDDRWTFDGLRVVTLENDVLRADILPELGAKVYRLIHKASDTDLLWHNPRVEPRRVDMGASYDDNFCGGWDELFPNDFAGPVGETTYPDHGELWCQPWTYTIDADTAEARVHLRRPGSVTTTIVEKTIALRPGDRQLRFSHRITNVGRQPLDFLWKLHPALAIDTGDRLDIPGAEGEVVDPTFGLVREPRTFRWPVASTPVGDVDFSVIRPIDGTRDFLYVKQLSAGWSALRRMKRNVGFGLVFPREIFTSVWMFMTFGGWRGLETVVLEPCTTVPKDLVQAIRAGTCSHLESGAALSCDISAVLFDDVGSFRGLSDDGGVLR